MPAPLHSEPTRHIVNEKAKWITEDPWLLGGMKLMLVADKGANRASQLRADACPTPFETYSTHARLVLVAR